ncbi:hypothetical protein [Polaromonas sp. AER18D-145]|uniref:hypothetical protein n=1 Tax=Polaromonas sp. AER18D-145 TaxID=1977060 RepID=UPI000BBBBAE0|nr:hypothetical protein [Polaromonas sp. AER18D-145]
MNSFKRIATVLALAATTLLSACSKTVQWEEEVPLNTGEAIWVKRTVVYSAQGGAGNPLDIKYRPERDEAIEFAWNGKTYRYQGDARIMLLAISPQKKPVLVARAEDNAWEARHNYPCTIPYYVQLVPDQTGNAWTWPSKIESWLYDLVPNLLLERHAPNQMKKRYSAQERQTEDYPGAVQSPSKQRIDPAFTGDLCKRKEK